MAAVQDPQQPFCIWAGAIVKGQIDDLVRNSRILWSREALRKTQYRKTQPRLDPPGDGADFSAL